MAPVPDRGQLKTWKDDRGFGFIKPDDGGKDVFLHISALPADCRRPQIGDTILYEKVTQADGKVRAAKASIQGVVLSPPQTTTPISTTLRPQTAKSIPTTPRPRTARRQSIQDIWLEAVVGVLGLTTVALFALPFVHRTLLSPVASILPLPTEPPSTTTPPSPVAQPSTKPSPSSTTQLSTKPSPSPTASPSTTTPPAPAAQPSTTTPLSPVDAVAEPACTVKGNISISSGNKLYHVPGMEDYEGTEIHLDKGERWFCTEAEAIAAGWRRAPR
ncbi:cold shock domain-containing protein [Nodosilinea sp. FACHB-13]|uniref:cold shock domain-containing protein n=1 Tax=Cyanophyceae TaxID=3028117 RepID=UPI0018F007F4|nr:cold shock domain-containing protein [Nodosilinea sp. FACHB-13]